MVTTFYPPYNFGGDGVYVQRLARALCRRGHSVEVIHDTDGYRTLAGRDPVDDAPDPDGVVVRRLRSRFGGLATLAAQQFGRPMAHARALRDLLTDRFDVIHFHNISLIGGPAVWSFGNAVKLHTAHEHWLVCPTHILWRDNKEICDERRCLSCILHHKRPPQLWRSTNLIAREARHVDAFLMLSRSAEANHRRFGFSAPMTVVPSFLPEAESSAFPSAPVDDAASPYFLFVGRLEIIKGLQDVIPHFDDDSAAELWIAGSGSYEPELRRLAEGRRKVRFLGRQSMDQLRHLYRNALAVVTPSSCYEVFPMVVLEAFREGTPIIARDLGPYPEIIDKTGGGLLFSDAASLRDALYRLVTVPGLARELGQRGLDGFQANWSEDVALGVYFDVIQSVAQRKGMQALQTKLKPFAPGANAAMA
jgi:glycosyltransferase involved in cell wall biosynthesis